ncbi:tetratricopeptide repeat protein [Cellulomonas denverensis]|uniref:Tetratricopeptide repeat protein n=1 Tax=Cellulomonas denverensis TaxID=264297 RepID=A0A7X6KVM8_9CELL|nr:tetratricopeptide repeat protein [Cellulomonas denverensis]NKY22843.1 tetratricopeptide repeat protein [Cellulomonas denverensis]GIG25216.1 membrane protein [Cellulomonas denverensis]
MGGRRRTSLIAAVALTALLGLYLWLVLGRSVALIRTGEPAGIGLGLGFAVLPLLVLVLVAREWFLAIDVQRMADTLAERDELPVDDLPRSPGGRIDRAAAVAAFDQARTEAEQAADDDWGAWYRLAFAYEAAGDRKRARATLRTASRIHRGRGTGSE